MPRFLGGDTTLHKFLSANIRYPERARRNHVEGKVLIKFVVNEDGRVSNVTVVRGVSPEIDAEAVRVIKLLPKFEPAKQSGKPVKIYFNIPVTFKLTSPPKEIKGTKKNYDTQNPSIVSFIMDNIFYPQIPDHRHFEGRVTTEYTVDEEDEVTNLRITQSVSPEIDSEVVRIVKLYKNGGITKPSGEYGKVYAKRSFLLKVDTNEMGYWIKDVNFEQGLAELKLSNFRKASHFFELSIEQFPNDFLGYQYKGVCEANVFKIGQACKDFRKAKELGSKEVDTYLENNCRDSR